MPQTQSQNNNHPNVVMCDAFFEKFATHVHDDYEKINYLERKFENPFYASEAEMKIHQMAREISKDYQGGSWELANINNHPDIAFMYPSRGIADETIFFDLSSMNYSTDITVDERVFGLIACLMAYSHASFVNDKNYSKLMSKQYQKLKSTFFVLVEKFLYKGDDDYTDEISQEEAQSIKYMSQRVYSFLD